MTDTVCFPEESGIVRLPPSWMAFPSTNMYACLGVTLIFSFPVCAKLALAQAQQPPRE